MNDTSEILETLKWRPTKLVDANGHAVYPSVFGDDWYCHVLRCRGDTTARLYPTVWNDSDYILAFEVYDDE